MEIKINGVSFTDKVNRDSLRIRKYGSRRSDASFTVEFSGGYTGNIRAGMEVIIKDGTKTLWAGVAEKVTCNIVDSDFVSVGVFGRGYESLVSRCVATAVSRTFSGAFSAYNYVYLHYLKAEGISMSSDIVDKTYPLEISVGGALSVTELLDIIGNYYGYVWWIDDAKYFHAAEAFPVTASDYVVNLDASNGNGIIEAAVAESIEDYRNVQYISLNANSQFAFVENTDAIERMSGYLGSGEFAKIGRKPRVVDRDYGKGLATKMLDNFDEPPFFIRFTSDDADGIISLFSKITVMSAAIGGSKSFVVTSVDMKYCYGGKFLTVTGYAFSGENYMPIINTMKSITFTI